MTPERWNQVERIYHETLERPSSERARFVDQACGADEDLRAEVSSLLEYQPRAATFLESPDSGGRSPVAEAIEQVRASVPGCYAGATFGAYELQAFIAAGGMGEVYRARDTRLGRTVAIKILPDQFADDPERRLRFLREARMVSSLSHPNICAIYDVGEQEGVQYLVMEYIDGESLHDRLRRGPVPAAEALDALIQFADALDKAHRRGVVHRDLKPGNVMWTRPGVKLLDFGLAARRPPRHAAPDDVLAADPASVLTVQGTMMGTVQYMAPEQLHGLATDARTDIFAFGAIAYEMLTGRPAFAGDTTAALIGAVLKDEPQAIAEIAPGVPASLADTLARCLAKDPEERWQTAADLLFQLRSLHDRPGVQRIAPRRRQLPRRFERALWAALAMAAAVGGSQWLGERGPSDATSSLPTVLFSVPPAPGTTISGFFTPFAVSPDGRSLVYASAGEDGVRHLWLQPLDAQRARVLPGTEGAGTPFWSPDSQWVAFFAARSLKKTRVSTGVTQTIATDVITVGGATWGANDDIVFAGSLRGLTRVAAGGGPLTTLDLEPGNQFCPQFLGDGRHLIYVATRRNVVAVASLDGGPTRTIMPLPTGTSSVAYAAGHVFFVQDGKLLARPFDESQLRFTGEARALVSGIPAGLPSRSPFSVSNAGVLAYWTHPLGVPAALRWFGRDGRGSVAIPAPTRYRGFTLARDGARLIFSRIGQGGGEDLWLRDLRDGREAQITFDGAAFLPLWSPDDQRVAFSGFALRPPPKAYVRAVPGDRAASVAGESPMPTFATGWTPDGRAIVVGRAASQTSHHDLWTQPLGHGAATPLWFSTPANETQGKVSPDGRWIAYTSDQSGTAQVWIASYPSGPVNQQVSRGGGDYPQWGSDELFYLSPDRRIMAARIRAGSNGLQVNPPQALLSVPDVVDPDPLIATSSNPFVVTPDGQRFLLAERAREPDAPPLTVLVNWPALMKR